MAATDLDLSLDELKLLRAMSVPAPTWPNPSEQLAYLLLTFTCIVLTRAIAEKTGGES